MIQRNDSTDPVEDAVTTTVTFTSTIGSFHLHQANTYIYIDCFLINVVSENPIICALNISYYFKFGSKIIYQLFQDHRRVTSVILLFILWQTG